MWMFSRNVFPNNIKMTLDDDEDKTLLDLPTMQYFSKFISYLDMSVNYYPIPIVFNGKRESR